MSILDRLKAESKLKSQEVFTMQEYLTLAREDRSAYATWAERMLKAIGEPTLVDTSKDLRLRIIHGNATIKIYKPFSEVYGMEHVIERLVSFFTHSAQGLEESRQICELHGPVASAKSTLAEVLKRLMEQEPIFVLKAGTELSPVLDSPLALFNGEDAEELGVPSRYINMHIPSAWAIKRLDEFGGDLSKFSVVKLFPSKLRELGIAKVEPGDENTQDTSVLVGKAKLRALGKFDQSDPDAYDFSGGLNKTNQGLLEMVELQKASIKTIHPLLTATQERNYNGTEAVGAMPFTGGIIAHTNDTEWEEFRNNRNNEAFIDRIYPIPVGYNLRLDEEVLIYKKLLNNSSLLGAPCAPGVLEAMAEFSILTRLSGDSGDLLTKMKVYNGESMKAKDSNAKTHAEYKRHADATEGFKGMSTRQAYKILSRVFNYDHHEIAANPVHLLSVLSDHITEEGYPKELQLFYKSLVTQHLYTNLKRRLQEDIRAAYIDSYDEWGQNVYDRYVQHADYWLRNEDYKDPQTGHIFDRAALERELLKIEIKAEISNPKDFRQEIRDFSLRVQAKNGGRNPNWKDYEAMKEVIDANITESLETMLPVISTSGSMSKESQKKNSDFIQRMIKKGYTERQVKVIVDWISQKA